MRIALLGPLVVEGDAGAIELPAAKERSLLAALALSPGVPTGVDVLIAALWGEAPPATARKTLQTYVSNVRRALPDDVLVTTPSGYALRVAPVDVDVVRFRNLVHRAEAALRRDATVEARDLLHEALGMWRGEPFADVAAHSGLAAEAVRLREEYVTALEARIAADLATGRHADLVGELEGLVREHPFRERLWGHLMVALYRSGRQADALGTYQRARTILVEELGLEPGGELRRLERAVLDQDPSLDLAPPATAPPPRPSGVPTPVRYAKTGDGVHIAYRVVGDGPVDVLVVPGFPSHLDMWWDAPTDHLVRRLAAFSRLILFDKRGMGLSDRPPDVDVGRWVDDAIAVLDAVGSEQAVVLGISAGTPTALLLAAHHPDRARALVAWGGYARVLNGDGYDLGLDEPEIESFIAHLEEHWGTGVGISTFAPSRSADPVARAYWGRMQTMSASPHAAAVYFRAGVELDVRTALSEIRAPTLILHAKRDATIPVEAARLMHERIPDATLVELDSDVHLVWLSDVVDTAALEIEEFVGRSLSRI